MRSLTTIIFSVTGRLVALVLAKPIPNWKAGGMAIPLTRHPSSLNPNKSADLDAIASHAISVREKILSNLDNYEINTGTVHPFSRKWSESGLGKRGASVPLTSYQSEVWVGEISIGTPPKTLKVQIDTGSADMWVLETGCSSVVYGDCNFWDPDLSETAQNQGKSFRLKYSDGTTLQGYRYTDKVTIAGFTADPQTFGSAILYTSPLQNNEFHADGLLGLAFPSISKFRADPLFESLFKQNRLINPSFSLKLSSSGAELYVGGANSILYAGDITYTPVTNPGLWQVYMDDVRVNGNTILENVPVIFDTGANYIFGDSERDSELYRRLGSSSTPKGRASFDFYYLPCDSFPTVSFTFGGKSFEIPSEALRLHPIDEGSSNCFSAIVAEHSLVAYWNIGITFLQGVYSVFDYNTLQVGFADLA